ncbi:hypothetical protein HED50_12770 [Ochrobactrum oryzae]|nr:hypothetical protein [Brucella oryzae]
MLVSFETPGYILNGGTLTLAGAKPTIASIGSSTGVTINSVITGTSGFTKTLAGTVELNGVNTFTGTISVEGERSLSMAMLLLALR